MPMPALMPPPAIPTHGPAPTTTPGARTMGGRGRPLTSSWMVLNTLDLCTNTLYAGNFQPTDCTSAYPLGAASDSGKGETFVSVTSSVSVLSDRTDTAVAHVASGYSPEGLAYDSGKGEVFVANYFSNNVSVISDATDQTVASVAVPNYPAVAAYDSGKSEVFVGSSGNVSVISDATNAVVATVPCPVSAAGIAYDPAKGEVFVAGSFVIYVISDSTDKVVAQLNLTGSAGGLAYDPTRGGVFAANGSALSLISDTTDSVAATVPLGFLASGVAYDPTAGELLVAGDPANVSVVSDATDAVVASVTVGRQPVAVTYDPSLGVGKVVNEVQGTVSTLANPSGAEYGVNFTESGLPNGTSWGVTMDNYTYSGTSNSISFPVPNGTYSFQVGNVPGFTPIPSSGNITVNGAPQRQAVTFVTGHPYPVHLTETGLPPGTFWSVILGSAGRTANSSTISFNETNGTYAFTILGTYCETPTPASGNVTVAGALVTVPVTFHLSGGCYDLTFTESGMLLVPGVWWSVNFTGPNGGGASYLMSQPSVTFVVRNGTYAFQVIAIGYAPVPASGNVTVTGAPVSVAITMVAKGVYAVTFVETGLPVGQKWAVSLNGTTERTSALSMGFLARNGSEGFFVGAISHYSSLPSAGTIVVAGHDLSVDIQFQPSSTMAYPVNFTETGLPAGLTFDVEFDGGFQAASPPDANFVTFDAVNGTYSFVAWDTGATATPVQPTPETGYLTVHGEPIVVAIAYTPAPFCLGTIQINWTSTSVQGMTATVTGDVFDDSPSCTLLSLGWQWGDGQTSSSFLPATHTYAKPGTYWWIMTMELSDGASFSISQSVTIAGPTGYLVDFSESGLRPGTHYAVALGGVNVTASANQSIAFYVPNGTYSFSVGMVPGYTAYPATGITKVRGVALSELIRFTPVNGTVDAATFTETGLPVGTSWSVQLNGLTEDSVTNSILFQVVNGTYAYTVGHVSGYTASVSSGSLTLKGGPESVDVIFSVARPHTTASPWWLFGLPGDQGYAVWAVVGVSVVGGSLLVALRLRHRPQPPAREGPETPSSDPPGASEPETSGTKPSAPPAGEGPA